MRFILQTNLRSKVFVPYVTHGRKYSILLSKYLPAGTKLSVSDSPLVPADTYIRVGDLHLGGYEGETIGHLFYTPLSFMCYGSALLAYSKAWEKRANNKELGVPSGVLLIARTPLFYLYHKKNEVTLAVNPTLPAAIKDNLES